MKPLTPTQRTRARRLRRKHTDAEARLWRRLRNRQLVNAKFRRQQALSAFVVDFCCMEVGLLIEVDGGQHAERCTADAERTAQLAAAGWRLLRFWNHDVLHRIDSVLEQIRLAVEECRRAGRRFGTSS